MTQTSRWTPGCQCCNPCDPSCGYLFQGQTAIGKPCKVCTGRCPDGGRTGCRQGGWNETITGDARWEYVTAGDGVSCLFRLAGTLGTAAWFVPLLCRDDAGAIDWYPSGMPTRITWQLDIDRATGWRAWCGLLNGPGVMLDARDAVNRLTIRARSASISSDGSYSTLSSEVPLPTITATTARIDLELVSSLYLTNTLYDVHVHVYDAETIRYSLLLGQLLTFGSPPNYVVFGGEIGSSGQTPAPYGTGTTPAARVQCIQDSGCDICGVNLAPNLPECADGVEALNQAAPEEFSLSANVTAAGGHPMSSPNLLPAPDVILATDAPQGLVAGYKAWNCDPGGEFYESNSVDHRAWVYGITVESSEDPAACSGDFDGPWKEDYSASLNKPAESEGITEPDATTGLWTMDLRIDYRVYTRLGDDPTLPGSPVPTTCDRRAHAIYRCVGFRCGTTSTFTKLSEVQGCFLTSGCSDIVVFPSTVTVEPPP